MFSLLTTQPRNLLHVALPPSSNGAKATVISTHSSIEPVTPFSAKEADEITRPLIGFINSTIERGKTTSIHRDIKALIGKLEGLRKVRDENIEQLTVALRILLVSSGKKPATAMDDLIAKAGNSEDASSIFEKVEAHATEPAITADVTALTQDIIAKIRASRDPQLHKALSSDILSIRVSNATGSLDYPINTLYRIEEAAAPLAPNDFVQSVKKASRAIAKQNALLNKAVEELLKEMNDVGMYGPAVEKHLVRAKL